LSNCEISLIVKTPLGLEKILATRIEELGFKCEVKPKPQGYPGLVIVQSLSELEKFELGSKIKKEIPEAERVLVSMDCVEAKLQKIVDAAVKIAMETMSGERSFAVRTVRRGSHPYTSVDVNRAVGSGIVATLGAPVDLSCPDKIIWVEIIGNSAAIGICEGSEVWRKLTPEKAEVRRFFSKVSVIQMPYLGSKSAVRTMGVRIGRAVQMFEVGELVVGILGSPKAKELSWFIESLIEGIASRYNIQTKTYAHKPRRVEVLVQDIYQLVRDRRDEPKIVFEPEGQVFPKVADKLAEYFLSDTRRVNLLFGSREGIPKGIFRFADLVVDLCPGITLSTEYAASSALIGIAYKLEERLLREKE